MGGCESVEKYCILTLSPSQAANRNPQGGKEEFHIKSSFFLQPMLACYNQTEKKKRKESERRRNACAFVADFFKTLGITRQSNTIVTDKTSLQ